MGRCRPCTWVYNRHLVLHHSSNKVSGVFTWDKGKGKVIGGGKEVDMVGEAEEGVVDSVEARRSRCFSNASLLY